MNTKNTFETAFDAIAAGYVTPNEIKKMLHHTPFILRDTSGGQSQGYHYAICRDDQQLLTTEDIWLTLGRNRGGSIGASSTRFYLPDVLSLLQAEGIEPEYMPGIGDIPTETPAYSTGARRYNVKTATLLAIGIQDKQKIFMFRTPTGGFFTVTRDGAGMETITVIEDDLAALDLYRALEDKHVTEAEAFAPVEVRAGRPTIAPGEATIFVGVYLPASQAEWLRAQPENPSKTIRTMIAHAMGNGS